MGIGASQKNRVERMFVVFLSAAAPFFYGYLAFFQAYIYESYAAAAVLVVLSVGTAASYLLFRDAKARTMTPFLVSEVIAVVSVSYLRGGVIPGVLMWLLMPIVASLLAFRVRRALLWTGVGAVSVLGLAVVETLQWTPPRIESTESGLVAGTVGAIVMLTFTVFGQAWIRQGEHEERVRMLERLSRANKLESVARLASGVAHDFNNLLTVITNHTQLLAQQGRREDAADIDAIQHAANAGAALTRRLLAIGRERKEDVDTTIVDANSVATKAAALLRSLLPASVRLEFTPSALPVAVRANPWDLHQVIMNLVINARNAMPRGGAVHLKLTCENFKGARDLRFGTLAAGRYVVVSVGDEGVGMSETLMNQVVEPFFTTRGRAGGTGLGLSIVHGVVASLGGQLDIESKVDVGTTFHVILPWTDAEPAAIAVTPESPTSGFPALASRILVVDDDPAVRRAMVRLLGLEGHEVVSAGSGQEAREVFETHNVDVIVSDLTMPGESGLELASELLRRREDLGVVFVSGDPDSRLGEQPLASKNVRFLTKPAARRDLRNAVRAVAPPPPRVSGERPISSNPPEEAPEVSQLN
ncbi:MAG: response regulator [Myxococcota bacterium]